MTLGIGFQDADFVGAFALLGLLIGSFLNVVVHRLPRMMERQWQAELNATAAANPDSASPNVPSQPELTLMRPGSHCPRCGHVLRWHENIPLLSYAVLRGRCSACQGAIGLRYPLVEMGTALLFAGCATLSGGTQLPNVLNALAWCGFCATLLALALIDLDTYLLPDPLTQPLLWAGLGGAALGWTGTGLTDAFWGAAAGYLSLWLLAAAFHWITGREGMGHGDFKLLAALGGWLGWAALPPMLLLASSLGALVGLALLWRQRRATVQTMHSDSAQPTPLYIPFGPFLAAAGLVLMASGHDAFYSALGLRLTDVGLVLK